MTKEKKLRKYIPLSMVAQCLKCKAEKKVTVAWFTDYTVEKVRMECGHVRTLPEPEAK